MRMLRAEQSRDWYAYARMHGRLPSSRWLTRLLHAQKILCIVKASQLSNCVAVLACLAKIKLQLI